LKLNSKTGNIHQ